MERAFLPVNQENSIMGIGKMMWWMGKEHLSLSRRLMSMKGNGSKGRNRDMALKHTKMVPSIRVHLLTEKRRDLENFYIQMELSMKDNSRKIYFRGRVSMLGRPIDMREAGAMAGCMALAKVNGLVKMGSPSATTSESTVSERKTVLVNIPTSTATFTKQYG